MEGRGGDRALRRAGADTETDQVIKPTSLAPMQHLKDSIILDDAPPTARLWSRPKHHRPSIRPPFECIALMLQGGGALGSYQAGVYEALAEADLHPDWVAGISIGAINSALIAGNAPSERIAKLRSFWEEVTANPLLDWVVALESLTPRGDFARELFNQLSAVSALTRGAPSFFELRRPLAWLHPNGAHEATSLYETKLLKTTLEHESEVVGSNPSRRDISPSRIRTFSSAGSTFG